MGKITRKHIVLALLCLLAAAAAVFLFHRERLSGWEAPKALSFSQQRRIEGDILQIARDCRELRTAQPSRAEVDAMEARLIAQGHPVIDTDAVYPAYFSAPDPLRQFCADVSAGKDATQTLIRVGSDGGFTHLFFRHARGQTICILTRVGWGGENQPRVQSCETLTVYDMELSYWYFFFYRFFTAGDPHYIDYMQLRLAPPDRELYDLTRKYILPIGYQMVNFFLCDWSEGDWGGMSFNDLFEYLYIRETGEPQFSWVGYADPENPTRAILPAALFEDTVLTYFAISREELRELALYREDAVGYPWRPFFGDDLTTRSFPMCEPQVISATQNSDGALTLSVQVASPELKTDKLFCHEVVVRPLADGNFQYVSNRMTYVGQQGLPYHLPRFALDKPHA